jgi:CBS domain-containing protein
MVLPSPKGRGAGGEGNVKGGLLMRNKQRIARVSDVMTPDVVSVQLHDTLAVAARAMREHNIGDVIVLNGEQLFGIITDRDIVIRGIAEGFQPDVTEVKDIASKHIRTTSPEDNVDDAMNQSQKSALSYGPDAGVSFK